VPRSRARIAVWIQLGHEQPDIADDDVQRTVDLMCDSASKDNLSPFTRRGARRHQSRLTWGSSCTM
jgi:hypothetical protein